jgi:glycosyltransferase involved in cell wall biosynthesis
MQTLVVLTPGFPKDEEDTSCLPAFQQFTLSLQRCFPKTEFIVITFQYPYFKGEYLWHNIRVISLGGNNRAGLSKRILWYKCIQTLKKLNKEKFLCGVLSFWLSECALIGERFCRSYDLKHYMWLIGQDAKKENSYIKRIHPKATSIIAMSDFLQQELYTNHGIKPFMIAENGVNEMAFPVFNSGERKIDILGAGWLTALKNYSLFLDIVYEVKKVVPNVNAVIVGEGEEEKFLKEKVKALNLENNVLFMGLLPQADVLKLMSESKIFLHTSNYEGNSTVLMEALYSGCYTVSTQPLSNTPTKNLMVTTNKNEMVSLVLIRLKETQTPAERITFNTMDETAKKIMSLYI